MRLSSENIWNGAVVQIVASGEVPEVDRFAGMWLGLGLTAGVIALLVTVVGFTLLKTGMVKQSPFDPGKFLLGLWGMVLIVSMPSLIGWGSTFMPAPARTEAQAVTPAYESDVVSANNQAGGGNGKEDLKSILGSSYGKYESQIKNEMHNALIVRYKKNASEDAGVDPCYQIEVSWTSVTGGLNNGNFEDHLEHVTPDGYSPERCGGPVKPLDDQDVTEYKK